MKKIFIIFTILLLAQSAFAAKNYEKMYNETEVPQIKLMHDLDPYQDEDYFNYAWSPYPLFRTATTLYFKDITIPPGYYLLAARNIKNKDYIFFKANGKVKYIIPVAETELVLEESYKGKIPEKKLNKAQKTKKKITHFLDNLFENTKKIDPPTSFIQAQQLDNNFIEIIYYFGNQKYTMYFRTTSF